MSNDDVDIETRLKQFTEQITKMEQELKNTRNLLDKVVAAVSEGGEIDEELLQRMDEAEDQLAKPRVIYHTRPTVRWMNMFPPPRRSKNKRPSRGSKGFKPVKFGRIR